MPPIGSDLDVFVLFCNIEKHGGKGTQISSICVLFFFFFFFFFKVQVQRFRNSTSTLGGRHNNFLFDAFSSTALMVPRESGKKVIENE